MSYRYYTHRTLRLEPFGGPSVGGTAVSVVGDGTSLGRLGPALALQLLQFARSAGAALAVLTPLVALCGLAPKAGYLSHIVDVAPNHSGIVMGMACSVSVLPSIMSNMIPQVCRAVL